MAQGTVKWFDMKKGYGFITPEDGGKDVFVPYSEVEGGGKKMRESVRVEFVLSSGEKGPCAKGVKTL